MKNAYLTSHFPILAILFFCLSFGIWTQQYTAAFLETAGIYQGMLEFFSENGIKLTMLFILMLAFFMIIAALKLISDTMMGLSLLFFLNDETGDARSYLQSCGWIYLIAGGVSLFLTSQLYLLGGLFIGATLLSFVYLIIRLAPSLRFTGVAGFFLLHLSFWGLFIIGTGYAFLRLYNSFLHSLPV
ncbi:DUF5366 family protein [Marinococcus halophilus]|uniref:DUF5366 family protein n=1 Tax=Marinococcus halophilus TaxID=1371 RepID=UPI0009A8E490|nr:DUF5366 family protein [Marinococcus halophilus]